MNNEQQVKYNYQKADFLKFCTELEVNNWDLEIGPETSKSPDEKLDLLYHHMYQIRDKYVPKLKTRNNKSNFPIWWTNECKKMYKRKERLRKVKNKPSRQNNEYKTLRKQVKSQIKMDYKKYVDDVVQKLKTDSKHFWQFYKNKKALAKKDTLTHNGIELTDPQNIADSFATHFINAYNHNIPPDLNEPITSDETSHTYRRNYRKRSRN